MDDGPALAEGMARMATRTIVADRRTALIWIQQERLRLRQLLEAERSRMRRELQDSHEAFMAEVAELRREVADLRISLCEARVEIQKWKVLADFANGIGVPPPYRELH
jgi:hypothetical protein